MSLKPHIKPDLPLFATSSQVLRRLPTRPDILHRGLLAAHYLPSLTLMGLGLMLWFTETPTAMQTWMNESYRFNTQGYGAMTGMCGVVSLLLARWPGSLRRLPSAQFILMVILTFPLILYLLSAWWFSVVVNPSSSKVAAWLYTTAYLKMLALYAIDAGFRQWFGALASWANERNEANKQKANPNPAGEG